ncbi:hypothetical protein H112_05761 [Trichophyton rubrum D6]|nr:hypothetical protein H100_05778 [Trichophyton rubrum MR850]EZF40454.1 hypothetical protein H102_05746 [Trichophyton rubrum CBS 100081]EZF50962.1 hypothetical protein H103_05774 [Trichophyton rubrum CBS 288.86]EZF61677.1 hypothetical protein H104_05758 [Trichophyton rubrum CBS 289.86]EZF72066.1 hypothetical protein H105_05787 [Trichophyton soudanense CBS 452.61]EZF82788.1 hypothetical protein H110_05767 [Trichophyton rubrum MR1448]EZF93647.1 hypothetical protein H113_05815 [Trichophyton rub
MPSLSSYTPFESLLFFQSLATLKCRPDSFVPVSELLRNNPFIQQDVKYDANRLSPQALEELYTTLLVDGVRSSDDEASDHSHSAQDAANLKKRKHAQAAQDGTARSHSAAMPDLVDKLYARYKARVTREIRREEQRYAEIKDEIRRLEAGEDLQKQPVTADGSNVAPSTSVGAPPATTATPPPKPEAAREKVVGRIPQEAVQTPAQTPTTAGSPQGVRPVQPTAGPPAATAPQEAPINSTYNFKSVLLANQGQQLQQQQQPQQPQLPSQASPPVSTPGPNIYPNIQPFPPPAHPTSTSAASQPAYQNVAPPIPLNRAAQQPPPPPPPPPNTTWNRTPQIPSKTVPQTVKFQPLLTPQTIPQSSYGHGSARSTPKPSNQARNKATPAPKPLAPSIDKPSIPLTQNPPLSAPLAIAPPLAGGVSTLTPLPTTTQPTVTPDAAALEKLRTQLPSFAHSIGKRPPRPSLVTPSGNTPWKIPGPISLPNEPGSPERPKSADISPISERALSPSGQEDVEQWTEQGSRRKLDLGGAAPRESPKHAGDASSPSNPPSGRPRTRGQSIASRGEDTRHIKNELPSTPGGITGDDMDSGHYRAKRKRSPSGSFSLAHEQQPSDWLKDSQYVMCSRTFGRTCGPIMNDVAAHKYASIFAKPLTNRDAPGYKDLIYRPQDIKSIKSAIHQGSRAVAAASEASQITEETPPSTTASASASAAAAAAAASGAGPSAKSNVLLATKSAELMPPKGIVNSSQLEKELIRMFANAIMFNPTPDHTFGPAFPMRTDFSSREGTRSAEPDEGGIINDTLEMYEDVEKAISTWRSAERPMDDAGGKAFLALKRGTPVDSNDADD